MITARKMQLLMSETILSSVNGKKISDEMNTDNTLLQNRLNQRFFKGFPSRKRQIMLITRRPQFSIAI